MCARTWSTLLTQQVKDVLGTMITTRNVEILTFIKVSSHLACAALALAEATGPTKEITPTLHALIHPVKQQTPYAKDANGTPSIPIHVDNLTPPAANYGATRVLPATAILAAAAMLGAARVLPVTAILGPTKVLRATTVILFLLLLLLSSQMTSAAPVVAELPQTTNSAPAQTTSTPTLTIPHFLLVLP